MALGAAWLSQFFYVFCFVPQIINNFKCSSTEGLSDINLFADLNAYITFQFFLFSFDFPPVYHITTFFQLLMMSTIVVQRFYYDTSPRSRRAEKIVMFNLLALISLLPLCLAYADVFGNVCGWISVTIFACSQSAQVIKTFRSKKLGVLSFWYLLFGCVAEMLALGSALALMLPVQSQIGNVLTIIFYGISFYQFFYYFQTRLVPAA